MPALDDILAAIDLIYASALDDSLMGRALVATGRLTGGVGSTMETIDKKLGRHREFLSAGAPHDQSEAYVQHFARVNPRIPHGLRLAVGQIDYDYRALDETTMRRDAFYADFLPRVGLRYYLASVIEQSDDTFAIYVTHRENGQGHASAEDIELMTRLGPHLRRAYDVRRRLAIRDAAANEIGECLLWTHEGAAILDAAGTMLSANAPLEVILARDDGVRRHAHRLTFADPAIQARFERALAACGAWRHDGKDHAAMADFLVPRDNDAPAYVVSCRPMSSNSAGMALVLVRDPESENEASLRMLRERFGLTVAEARLAIALQMGKPLAEHARRSGISLNTAYTHLSRLKFKMHCSRIGVLYQRLNELIVPLAMHRNDR